ncbi:SDR family oxidoreductase [Christiangramia forsetii]|uniref:Short-chain dehydrogenase/reductase family protein n=2 Tax=Christiangramia forsetii TaxID=411153 RepID=A0M1K4_CHRFK|nr:SDR family oxidoreductase [Christiangramia forsetii]GGG42311.1 oxidoreductase [Christiangramia forsetii]CAL66499.1 short-chain dehydrogenase/reductase family protein [Christiangramia forsetii KT0803]
MSMKGKTIIITGASSGIGEATAMRLAKEGVNVVLTARREEKLKELKSKIDKENGGKALVIPGDVTKKEDFKNLIDKTKKEFGSIDGLINNAGLMPLSYVKNLHTDEWDKMVDVNIKGVLNGVAAVLPTMMEQKSGNIINISSSAARKIYPGGAVYCATKSAVKMFSEGLRQELAPKFNINITSIEPGFVDTELTDTITDDEIKEDVLSNFKEMTPLQAEDIANAIYYSLSQPKRANVNDVFIMPTEQEQ